MAVRFKAGNLSVHISNLRWYAKQYEKDAAAKQKLSNGSLTKVRKATAIPNNEQNTQIYAEEVIRYKTNHESSIRMASRLRAIADRCEMALKLGMTTAAMNNLIVSMSKAIASSCSLEVITNLCDKMEASFENVDMIDHTMNTALHNNTVGSSSLADSRQVDDLIAQVSEESMLENLSNMAYTFPDVTTMHIPSKTKRISTCISSVCPSSSTSSIPQLPPPSQLPLPLQPPAIVTAPPQTLVTPTHYPENVGICQTNDAEDDSLFDSVLPSVSHLPRLTEREGTYNSCSHNHNNRRDIRKNNNNIIQNIPPLVLPPPVAIAPLDYLELSSYQQQHQQHQQQNQQEMPVMLPFSSFYPLPSVPSVSPNHAIPTHSHGSWSTQNPMSFSNHHVASSQWDRRPPTHQSRGPPISHYGYAPQPLTAPLSYTTRTTTTATQNYQSNQSFMLQGMMADRNLQERLDNLKQ